MTDEKLSGSVVLDETVTLTLHDVCEVCGLEQDVVIEMVHEGIAEPVDQAAGEWQFSGIAVARLRTAHVLQRDLHVNLAGAALAIELLEEIEALRVIDPESSE